MKPSKNQVILAGLIFHVLAAIFSIGFHQSDELFQVFEFAGYKLGINAAADLPWEFASHMRSGLLPLLVYSASRFFYALGITNPFYVALFLRILISLFSFGASVLLLKWFEKEMHSEKAKLHLWMFALLFWCIPYFHTRLSSENVATTLFIYGLVLVFNSLKRVPEFISLLLAGALFGLAFVCRFQLGFMVAGLFAWLLLIKRSKVIKLFPLAVGLLFAIGLGLLIDRWFYSQWVLSWWNYLDQNVFANKASNYGVSPFYFYFTEALLQLIPPFSLVLIFALIAFWIKLPKHVLTWITIPFIALHFFVGHKELRFLFPVLNFLPFMVLLFFQQTQGKSRLLTFIQTKSFVKFALVVNGLLLCFFTFKPADELSPCLKTIYETVKGDAPVLFYEARNPYNNAGELNYFRNPRIVNVHLEKDTVVNTVPKELYYFSEKFEDGDTLTKRGIVFYRVYRNFPAWFSYLNFNGWLNRANTYSIYKAK